MSPPANVAEAIRILDACETDLRDAMNMGYTTAVVVPGPVSTPEETTIVAIRTTGLPEPQARRAVLMPQEKYMAWRAAWEVLMAYTGWWGRLGRWPLGDGERAKRDPIEALKLPALGAAFTAISATLLAVKSPNWKPDVRLEAIVAPILFVAGAHCAYRKYEKIHR